MLYSFFRQYFARGDRVMDSGKGKKRTAKGRSAGPIKRILLQAAAELALLPDSIISRIFSQLDALSRIRLAQTCKRFWVMHVDPSIWRMADLSTMQLRWMQEC